MSRILLLEPDRILGKTYQEFLTAKGHSVTWCCTSQAALQALDINTVDTVIVELQIASHNGLEFLYELRSYTDWQELPVIINSVVPKIEIEKSLVLGQLNIQTYLYKPQTTLSQLLSAVTTVLHVNPA